MKASCYVRSGKKYLGAATILTVLTLMFSFASTFAPSSQAEWNKTYGGAETDVAYSVVQANDGGYALAGYTYSYGAGLYDFWLVKTDSSGDAQWDKTYGGTSSDGAYSAIQTSDGGYALTGFTTSFGAGSYDFWTVKTDSFGNVQWNKTYGGAGTDVAYSIVQTNDGGYALVGYSSSSGAGLYDFWLVRTDSAGRMQWNKTYGGSRLDQAYSVVQTADGGYALTGHTKSYGAGNSDFWLIKTDPFGTLQFNKTYGGPNSEAAYSVVQTNDGGYTLGGYTNSYGAGSYDFWLIKVDSSGNLLWSKTYGGANPDQAYSLIKTANGGYALAGYTNSSGAGMYDFWLIQTDSAGNVQLNKTYGGVNSDIAYSVAQTDDGGYALVGYTNSYGAGSYDFWLVKLVAGVYHNVAITSVTLSKTVVGKGYSMYVNATVENQGNVAETFRVSVYANATTIQTQTITLTGGTSTTIRNTWNTTDVTYGNCTISATAEPVPGEANTADNTYSDGIVLVTIAGDVNGDRTVDILDWSTLSAHWYPGPPLGPSGYSSNADINGDGAVDILDTSITSANWGRTAL